MVELWHLSAPPKPSGSCFQRFEEGDCILVKPLCSKLSEADDRSSVWRVRKLGHKDKAKVLFDKSSTQLPATEKALGCKAQTAVTRELPPDLRRRKHAPVRYGGRGRFGPGCSVQALGDRLDGEWLVRVN